MELWDTSDVERRGDIPYKATILRDLSDKNDGWNVETKDVSSQDKLDFTMRVKGGGIARLVPAGK